MKPWQLVLVGFTLLAAAGCRTDPAITLLERDNRRLEQEIWRLRGCIDDLQDELASCQRPGATVRSAGPVAGPAQSAPSTPPVAEAPDMSQPAVEMPSQPAQGVPEEFKRPAGRRPRDQHTPEPSSPSGPNIEIPSPAGSNVHPTSATTETTELIPFDPTGDSRQVDSIMLDPRMTGGISTGSDAADQGLLVVVEPRDGDGRTVDAPAEMSVVAYDPAVQEEDGHAALVARWDYTAEETATLFRRDGQRQAIHLVGGWPKELPKHSQLHIFVRYVTADGRNLEADREVEVAVSNQNPIRVTSAEEPLPSEPRIVRRDDRPKPRRPQWSPDRR